MTLDITKQTRKGRVHSFSNWNLLRYLSHAPFRPYSVIGAFGISSFCQRSASCNWNSWFLQRKSDIGFKTIYNKGVFSSGLKSNHWNLWGLPYAKTSATSSAVKDQGRRALVNGKISRTFRCLHKRKEKTIGKAWAKRLFLYCCIWGCWNCLKKQAFLQPSTKNRPVCKMQSTWVPICRP